MLHPDTVFLNGRFRTLDPERRSASAIAVKTGRVAAVGDDAGIRTLAAPGTEVVDMGGRLVVPGLVDAHCHLVSYGVTARREADLRGARSIADIQARLRDHLITAEIAP